MAPGFLSGSCSWRDGYWATGSLLSPCSSLQRLPCISIFLRRAAWGLGHSGPLIVYGSSYVRARTTCLCSWPDRNEQVEIKQWGHCAAMHLDQLGFVRTYLIIPFRCQCQGSECGLQGRTGTYIHGRHSERSQQTGKEWFNKLHVAWLQRAARTSLFFPTLRSREFHLQLFLMIPVIYMLRSARHQHATTVHVSNCNQPAVFLMHCHLLWMYTGYFI